MMFLRWWTWARQKEELFFSDRCWIILTTTSYCSSQLAARSIEYFDVCQTSETMRRIKRSQKQEKYEKIQARKRCLVLRRRKLEKWKFGLYISWNRKHTMRLYWVLTCSLEHLREVVDRWLQWIWFTGFFQMMFLRREDKQSHEPEKII